MRYRRRRRGYSAAWLLVLTSLMPTALAHAERRVDGLVLSGTLQSQNIVRHAAIDELDFIQQRNTAWLEARWEWRRRDGAGTAADTLADVRRGVLAGIADDTLGVDARRPGLAGIAAGFLGIDAARASLASRFSYDSVYDYTPIFRERDYRGRKPGRAADRDLADLSPRARDAIKYESSLREAYVDLESHRFGLALRIGKQQIVWGEADFLRMLDRANPLDTSWHFVEEIPPPSFGWDDLRIPLWFVDARKHLGVVGPLRDVVAEAYWNVGDWRPMRVAFLPRPWGLRIPHPLTNREDGAFFAPFAAERLDHSSLFRQGDYRRTPFENSQIGVRLAGEAPGGVRLGVYYFHQRWTGDDGSPTAPLRGVPDTPAGRVRTQALIARGTLPVAYIAPYIDTVGLSASWFAAPLATTWRLETVYDIGLRVFDRRKQTTFAPLLPGLARRDFWKGMIAADRPFALAFVNDDGATFVTAQWFVHHIMHNDDAFTGPLDLPTAGARARPFCGAGPTEPCPDPRGNGSFRDDLRSWESLVTFAAFTAYRGGRVMPVVGFALDPVNSFAANAFWNVDWVVTPGFVVSLTQRYFTSAQGDVRKGPFNPWLFGTMRGRSETAIRFSYQF